MDPLESKETYQKYVNKKSPNSPIFKNCFNAFWVGGLICTIGQVIFNICIFQISKMRFVKIADLLKYLTSVNCRSATG